MAIELETGPRLHIRIGSLAVAPLGFLPVDNRPAQAPHLVVDIERCQIVAMAPSERGVLLEQPLLRVEAKQLGFVVVVPRLDVGHGELVHLAIAVQHIEHGLAPVLRGLRQEFLRPHLLDLEALGKLHQLPQVRTCFTRRVDQLMPEVRAALGVAVGPFLFHPHGGRQDQVRRGRGDGGIGIRHHNEVVWIAIARIAFLHQVSGCLHVVGHHDPVGIELAILEHPMLLYCVITGFIGNGALWQLPDFFRGLAVLGIRDHHVRGQAVRERAHFARRATGRRLARQRERAVAWGRDLASEQVDVVDKVVGPDATRMLVEAHGPERHHLALRVCVQLSQLLEPVGRHACQLGGVLQGVRGDELGVLLICHGFGTIRITSIFGSFLQRMLWTQAITDVRIAQFEVAVLGHKLLVHTPCGDDVVGNVVQDRQVGLRLKGQLNIRQLIRTVLKGGQHSHLDVRCTQTAIRHTRPEHRMHFCHVRAPKHKGVRGFNVVIAAHGLIHAEGAHEAGHRRGHAVARIRIDVVGAKTGLEQLGCGIAFPDRPLARAEHAHAGRPLFLQRLLELLGHHIERGIP